MLILQILFYNMFSIINIFAESVCGYVDLMYLSWALVDGGYSLVPTGNKSLAPLMLTKICDAVWQP